MQRAIWVLENELAYGSSEFQNDARAINYYNWAVANNNGSIGNVRVLRLWGSYVNVSSAIGVRTN